MVEAAGNRAPNLDTEWAEGLRRRQRTRASSGGGDEPAVAADGKIHPRCIFEAIAKVAEPDYIAIADGGDLLELRQDRARRWHLHGLRRFRLPRRRRALRNRCSPRFPRPAGDLGQRRRGVRD